MMPQPYERCCDLTMKVRLAGEMFAQVAPGLICDDRSLTLLDLAPSTIWLPAGHARTMTHLNTGAFLDRWADLERELGPDAAVTGYLSLLDPDAQLPGRASLELRHPHITAAGLSYELRVIEGIVPRRSGACVLFLHLAAPTPRVPSSRAPHHQRRRHLP